MAMLKIRIKQGNGGKWRWHLYDAEDKHAGMSTIMGFNSYDAGLYWQPRNNKEVRRRCLELVLSSGNTDMD